VLNRAYSLLKVNAVDADKRQISGIATTPTPDSSGDVIEPLGVTFRNPLPLLFHHDRKQPVGRAIFQAPTKDGVAFEATFPIIDEPGTVKDRVDEAWHSVKAGLITGVSVGLSALMAHTEKLASGGVRILKSEVFELSLVTIPANYEATILTVKALDRAASGLHQPGVTGALPVVHAVKAASTMTTSEQIASFENTRAAKAGRMTAIMAKSAESGSTLDAAETEEYDTLKSEVDSVDAHLVRLKAHEKMLLASATPITAGITTPGTTPALAASDLRGGQSVITVKANVPKGTAYTRYVMAKVAGKNSISDAIRHVESNKQWMDQTPEVLMMLKAVVNPGTIAEPAWAAPLAIQQPLNDFLELLRPSTLLGKIPGLRQVPFNISMPIQTGGGTYAWVGEGAPKPVGNLQFASVTLGIAKAAGIIVISEELAKVSTPSAEMVVRNDMLKGMAQYLDVQFIDPTVAAVTNVSPASITNLANGYATAGTSGANARTDIKKADHADGTASGANNYPISECVLIMGEANAFALSTARRRAACRESRPDRQGRLYSTGLQTVTSQSAGGRGARARAVDSLRGRWRREHRRQP
jgi:HK97 family phage prohead protease